MKVIISCQEMYKDWLELITGDAVYAKFLDLWFYTPDKNTTKAMIRRFNDMISCWLMERCTWWYKLTPLGRRVNPKHCHVVASLQIKDCTKVSDMPKRGYKKNDVIRSVQAESQIKSENKLWNNVGLGVESFIDSSCGNDNISFSAPIEILHPMTPKPKHTLRQHIKSLFWL